MSSRIQRPSAHSATSSGRPMTSSAARYTSKNTQPPYWPIKYGRRAMLPMPMQAPDATQTKARAELQ